MAIKRYSLQSLSTRTLKSLLHYAPKTGKWRWIVARGGMNKNAVAGCLHHTGYRFIEIFGRSYLSSRLAHLYMEGCFPEHDMDHINRIREDDRWCNLRHVTAQCNVRNRGINKNNTSGITGVCYNKQNRKLTASIRIDNKLIHLGYFKQKINAAKARWKAEKKYGFSNCNTTSSAYLYTLKKERNHV